MKKLIICCLCFFWLSRIAHCAQMNKVELTDGSVIEAEIVSQDNGTYTLKSEGLGEVKIDASKIRRIESLSTEAAPGPGNPGSNADLLKSEVDKLKPVITNNQEIMKNVAGLVRDPQFQGILKDPDIVNAVRSGNVKALMSNDKFMNLTNHPAIKEIEKEIKNKSGE